MDVLSLDRIRSTPFPGAPLGSTPRERLRRRWQALLRRLGAPLPGGAGPGPSPSAVSQRAGRNLLLGWTASQILVGLGLLAWVTMTMPIDHAISPSVLDRTALAGETGGILVWTVFGLFGSMRSVHSRGMHFTFNLPFVGAAMVLGGPVAGAWVAFLSTIERRELATLPWYAILANHTLIVIATVAGGLTVIVANGVVLGATGDDKLAQFVSIVLGGVVLELAADAITAVTVMLRDRMTPSEVLWLVIDDFGRITLLEIALIWVLAMAFTDVAWWAPIVVGVTAVALAAGRGPTGTARGATISRDALQQLLDAKAGRMRRGGIRGATIASLEVCELDLVARQHGQSVTDRVLQVTHGRLGEACSRAEDLAVRVEGGAFVLFLAGVAHEADAVRKATQLVDDLARPIATEAGPVSVDVAIGLSVTRAWAGMPPASTLLRWAEQAMHVAADGARGCGGWHLHVPGEAEPFEDEWRSEERP